MQSHPQCRTCLGQYQASSAGLRSCWETGTAISFTDRCQVAGIIREVPQKHCARYTCLDLAAMAEGWANELCTNVICIIYMIK